MARPSFGLQEYQQLAAEKGIEFIGTPIPNSVTDKTEWRCPVCGKILKKSFHHLKYAKNPCRCRNVMCLKQEDYEKLAEKLGLEYISDLQPLNVFQKVPWRSNRTHSEFFASYHELGYDRIPLYLRGFVES